MSDPLIALALFALVSTGSPGGATSLATASGAQFGYARSLPLIFGISLSLALLVAVSGTGLSAAFLAVPSLSTAMRIIGSANLFFLAIKILTAGPPRSSNLGDARPIGFWGGAGLLVVNPKAWGMAVGVACTFSTVSDSPSTLALILGAVFFVAAALSLSVWTQLGSLLSNLLSVSWQWHAFNGALAVLLALSIASLRT